MCLLACNVATQWMRQATVRMSHHDEEYVNHEVDAGRRQDRHQRGYRVPLGQQAGLANHADQASTQSQRPDAEVRHRWLPQLRGAASQAYKIGRTKLQKTQHDWLQRPAKLGKTVSLQSLRPGTCSAAWQVVSGYRVHTARALT